MYLSEWKSTISMRKFISVLCEFVYIYICTKAEIMHNWIHLLVSIILFQMRINST